ncbi:hypothetical protein D8B26_008089 [Coccidioides posadasii str. Silveira]|nr:mitochondrial metal transporter 2 [Coccidioides posadasii RMSCC 3488]QVM13482.1 hypothetical protein D8B26_008089 [Coccidioides posadasii str. Silveira]
MPLTQLSTRARSGTVRLSLLICRRPHERTVPPTNEIAERRCSSIQQRVFQTSAKDISSQPFRAHAYGQKPATLLSHPLISTDRPSRPFLLAPLVAMSSHQVRNHGSHGHHHHHHHHHHDTTYLVSKNRSDPGVRITRIGLLANLAMAIGKGVGGYMFHSQALVADAYHSLTDLVSDFMTLATVTWSLKPPSSKFPTGYGKVETLGALGVSSLLLCGGFFMGLNAAEVLLVQAFPDIADMAAHWGLLGHGHSHGHSHSHGPAIGPNINAAWLAAGSIVIKEWLYHATMKIAIQRKSSVLASNAIHHRVDSLTSIVALLTIGGAHVFTDASWLDPVGGLLISLMVIRAGWGNSKTSLLELADVGVDEDMIDSVRKSAMKALATASSGSEVEIRDIQGIKSGPNYLMDIEMAVPETWSVGHTRHIEELVRQRVGARVKSVKRLKIRFTPNNQKEVTFAEEFIAPDISPRSSPEPEIEHSGAETAINSNPKLQQNGIRKRG